MDASVQTGWWFSADGESYEGGPFDTYDEAVEAGGRYYDVFTVSLCTREANIRLADYFDDDALDGVVERIEGAHGDPDSYGALFDLPTAQVDDLIEHIRKAVDEWQGRNNVVLVPWRFARVERSAKVDLTKKEASDGADLEEKGNG